MDPTVVFSESVDGIDWQALKAALAADDFDNGRTPEEYQGLRYDLAMAHEASGDADTALSIFTDLYGQDASFRDVAAKVRELKAAQG